MNEADRIYDPRITERAGQTSGGGYAGRAPVAEATKQAPVHAAQESLDKAISGLLNEVDHIRNALSSVLVPVNEATQKEREPMPQPHSVSERINLSTSAVSRAAQLLADTRQRLEV